ncbi:ceroid-lipofuscinosis neuronal protein 6 homolog [Cheilinus undulatus]|uniref:ceroid-lipofuscinosis neuronal protein 6 homolog n=1 Tax=Cheilinus undulatus TaxID=241271 RepID=UPI001BD5936C|nr:ceroid-lipofuscinosis neuronal protein 6 homolog [Cheilinus undulatus]
MADKLWGIFCHSSSQGGRGPVTVMMEGELLSTREQVFTEISGLSLNPDLRSVSSAEMDPVLSSKPRFHFDLWLCFTIQNWILDVGQPVAMILLPAGWLPLNRPSISDYLHFLFAVSAPLLLLKMLERSPRKLPRLAIHLSIISVVMGTSFHLVADSITRRLLLIGYQLHLPVRENPLMQELRPPSLVDIFELLFYLDDSLGHLMWYVPLFLILFLFFSGAFCHRKQEEKIPPAGWMLLAPSTAYYWFLITEGQTFILFIFTVFAMTATVMHQRRRGLVPDSNGLFMLYSFYGALVLVAVWVAYLWNDAVLRRKHPGLIYVPQPRAVYTLHLQNKKT